MKHETDEYIEAMENLLNELREIDDLIEFAYKRIYDLKRKKSDLRIQVHHLKKKSYRE